MIVVNAQPASRPGGRSARVRAAVQEATLGELLDKGWHAMTVEGIARRAGVNKTSLYRRWSGRGALLADALAGRAGEPELPPASGDLRRDLMALWNTAPLGGDARNLDRSIGTSRALAAAADDPEIAEVLRDLWDRRLALTRIIVKRAITAGQLPRRTDPEFFMDLLFGPFYTRVVVRRQPPTTRFMSRLMDAALQAVGANAGMPEG